MTQPNSSPIPTSEPATHKALRHKIELAVVAHDAPGVLQLLAAKSKVGLAVLGSGFGANIGAITRVSFAHYCMANQSEHVLESVLRSSLADQRNLLKRSCTWMRARLSEDGVDLCRPREYFQPLAYKAISMLSVAGTLLAIEFESDTPRMKSACLSPTNDSQMTFHAQALLRAMSNRENIEESFISAANVCRAYCSTSYQHKDRYPG